MDEYNAMSVSIPLKGRPAARVHTELGAAAEVFGSSLDEDAAKGTIDRLRLELLLLHLLLLLLLLLWTTAVLGRIRRGGCRRCSNANDDGAGAVGIMGRCRKAAGLVDVVAAASSMMASGWVDWPVTEWVVDRRTVMRSLPEPKKQKGQRAPHGLGPLIGYRTTRGRWGDDDPISLSPLARFSLTNNTQQPPTTAPATRLLDRHPHACPPARIFGLVVCLRGPMLHRSGRG